MTLPKKIKNEIIALGKALNNENKDKTLRRIRYLIIGHAYSNRSQSVNFSLAKTILKSYTNDTNFLKKIKPSDEIIKTIIAEDMKNRDIKSNITIKRNEIEKILNYHNSYDIFQLAIFLLLTSGKRTRELMDSKITSGSKKNLKINNILKRTDKNQNLEFIPMIPKTVFLKSYRKFKQLYKYTNKDTFQRSLNRSIKRNLGDVYYPHILRKIYANYLFKHRNTENLKINPFLKKVLLQQSVTSSLYYTGIKFDFVNDFVKKHKF